MIRCVHCGHTSRITSWELLCRFNADTTAKEMGRKMRCSECGEKGARIAPVPS